MTNKKTVKRRRGKPRKKSQRAVVTYRSSQDYVKAIIKCLEGVCRYTGERPSVVFDHFLEISHATLQALPEQVKAIAQTGQPGADTAEVAELFGKIRGHYESGSSYNDHKHQKIWHEGFCQAFALLLDSTKDGLWADWSGSHSVYGPDILGAIYTEWSNSSPKWNAQYFSPWSIAYLAGQLTCVDIEKDIHARILKALRHPDNILGQAALLTSLAIPDVDEISYSDWYLNQLVTFAYPFYDPIRFMEPACGSGILILGHAASSPKWAVMRNLIHYFAGDINYTCILMTKTNLQLYGLNGYGLQLTAAAAEAMQIWQERLKNTPPIEQNPRAVYDPDP